MVAGIEKFREHFAGHEDDYVLIGGAACDLVFANAGLEFRATKDLDVVLCVEVVSADFAATLADFIEAGGYDARQRSNGHREYFRFVKPSDNSYPFMLELFARQPDALSLPDNIGVTRISVEDDLLSLSAILLDQDYYDALRASRTAIDGVSLLDEQLLIPFKAKAYLDLTKRQSEGEEIPQKTIRKHRNDVFRLAQLLPAGANIELAESIRNDLREFVVAVGEDDTLNPKDFDVPLSRNEALALLDAVYALT